MELDSEQRQLGLEVAGHFTSNPKYTFEGFAGLGRHGGALILSEQMSQGRGHRKIVIKYSYGRLSLDPDPRGDADDDLLNEYYCLVLLRGAEHIVQLIPLADCDINIPGISNGKGGQGEATPGTRRCPTLALEYLPWGTLANFRVKLRNAEVRTLPSRLLWRLWLCMVRQCVAMAFPPKIYEEDYVMGYVAREVIKDEPYEGMMQNSGHHRNFVFSDAADLPGGEHEPRLPVLKLIDFGRGEIVQPEEADKYISDKPEEYASRANLFNAAESCMRIACLGSSRGGVFEMLEESITYRWRDRRADRFRETWTVAPAVLRENALIDPELRHLLVRLLTDDLARGPSLAEVLEETEAAVREKHAGAPGLKTAVGNLLGVSETDEAIMDIVQRFIYDAEQIPPDG